MIGHLGPRASALLDGQLSAADAEDAWAHVYTCHQCRDLIEREGWIKTRLAGIGGDPGAVPTGLKGSLLSLTPGESYLAPVGRERRGVSPGLAMLGGGALGAALVGFLALGALPGAGPGDRRPPAASINSATNSATPGSGSASPGAATPASRGPRTSAGRSPALGGPVGLPEPIAAFFG